LKVRDGGFRRFVPRAGPCEFGALFEQAPVVCDELRGGYFFDTEENVAEVVVLEVVSENAFED